MQNRTDHRPQTDDDQVAAAADPTDKTADDDPQRPGDERGGDAFQDDADQDTRQSQQEHPRINVVSVLHYPGMILHLSRFTGSEDQQGGKK